MGDGDVPSPIPYPLCWRVNVDRLELGEELAGGFALLAAVRAGAFHAAKRHLRLGPGRLAIDVDDARLDAAHEREGLAEIAREERGRQPEPYPVGDRDRLVQAVHWNHAQHRPEQLLLPEPRFG